MEMCYDGALVMPNSYAVMNEEEMMYTEGGRIKVSKAAKRIDIGVSVVLAAVGVGLGVGSIVWFMKNSVKGLVVASLKRAITSVLASLGFTTGSGIYSVLCSINPNWTIGTGVAKYIDKHEKGKKRNNGYVFG